MRQSLRMSDYRDLPMLTDYLADGLCRRHHGDMLICGLSGAQGAGKSTLAAAVCAALAARNLYCLILALDDFYLPLAARQKLAEDIHPLCRTRGVPGTHDVSRLTQVLTDLRDGKAVNLPQFDKTSDERTPKEAEPRVSVPPDIILLEGWCIGAVPSMIMDRPETDWETAHDPDAVWKGWSREASKSYDAVWAACHMLIQLRQNDFDEVIDARWLQEQGNAARSGRWQFENRAAVAVFCAHYESWTKALWRDLPARADIVVDRAVDFTYRIEKTLP